LQKVPTGSKGFSW